mgnify:CR=1 FL=1
MSIDKSILLDAHSIVYKNADGHDYGSFDQNMQDACNFAMVMTGHMVTMDMAYALMIGLKFAPHASSMANRSSFGPLRVCSWGNTTRRSYSSRCTAV